MLHSAFILILNQRYIQNMFSFFLKFGLKLKITEHNEGLDKFHLWL